MPTYGTTAINAFRYLTGANPVSDIDAGFQALAEDLEAKLGMVKISELTPTAGIITFSSIPQTFRHLRLVGMAKSSATAAGQTLALRMNNLSGATAYAWHYVDDDDGTPATAGDESDAQIAFSPLNKDTDANIWTSFDLLIPNYRATNNQKAVQGRAETMASADAICHIISSSGRLLSAPAVTRVDLFNKNGGASTLDAASMVSLYGLL